MLLGLLHKKAYLKLMFKMDAMVIPSKEDRKNFYMNFVRKTMLLLGIWPIKTGDFREILYECYFCMSFLYYIIFTISGFTLAVLTWTDNYLITASSMGMVIEYVCNAYKVLILKSESVKSLIYEIKEKEKNLFENNDVEFIKIYIKNAKSNKKIVLFYTIMGTTGISLYFITPLVSNILIPLGYNNETGVKNHHFIVFSWFPFDPNRYYWAAYLIQFTGCLYGYSYIVHCGAFYICMLSFIEVQLKLIQHVFINFSKYAENVRNKFDLTEEESQFVLLKNIVQEHLRIIRFVEKTNNAIKTFTLLNFIISSFQLSLVVYQIFEVPPIQRFTIFSYFFTLSTQLFLTYYAANAIATESENISASIFKGKWDTYPPEVLKLLQIVCIRAQKPLVMTIGPMGEVRLTALFQIFKALYSYICIIRKM